MDPLLLSPKEVARRLGIGINATLRLIADGTIPSVARPGSGTRRVVRASDLEAYVLSLGGGHGRT